MYIKLKVEVSQQKVLITSVIREAIKLADKLDIMVVFEYGGILIEVDGNSDSLEVAKEWANKFDKKMGN